MKKCKQKLAVWGMRLQADLQKLFSDEEGMEVIQVLVLLAIGLGIIILFMTLGGKITDAVKEKVEDFLSKF